MTPGPTTILSRLSQSARHLSHLTEAFRRVVERARITFDTLEDMMDDLNADLDSLRTEILDLASDLDALLAQPQPDMDAARAKVASLRAAVGVADTAVEDRTGTHTDPAPPQPTP
jgi:predicted  nucleic acid-binding Zn-ribbon protein